MGYIVKSGAAQPNEMLAVTFTNKAAKEMLVRVNDIVDTTGIWLSTFHSIAARMLRNHADSVGLSSNFSIIRTDDQLQLVKTVVGELAPHYPAAECKKILHAIQRWKEKGLLPRDVTETELQKNSSYFVNEENMVGQSPFASNGYYSAFTIVRKQKTVAINNKNLLHAIGGMSIR